MNTVNNISLVGILKLALKYIYILIAVALVAAVIAYGIYETETPCLVSFVIP